VGESTACERGEARSLEPVNRATAEREGRRAPSPRAFSFHEKELGLGSIQNLNISFHAGSSAISPW
jgi:hypothetical protein